MTSRRSSRSAAAGNRVRNKILFGMSFAIVLLLFAIFIPWPGSDFPQNISVAGIALAAGVAVLFIPGRFLGLWLFLGLMVTAAILTFVGTPRYATVFFAYLGGAEFGATAQLIFRRRNHVPTKVTPVVGKQPDGLVIGIYPRDDIRWADDGVDRSGLLEVQFGSGDAATRESRKMGEFDPFSPAIPVGVVFQLRITATFGPEKYDQSFRFRVTGDEDDVRHYTVGPGMQLAGRSRRRFTGGFEFGATVMGAQLETAPSS